MIGDYSFALFMLLDSAGRIRLALGRVFAMLILGTELFMIRLALGQLLIPHEADRKKKQMNFNYRISIVKCASIIVMSRLNNCIRPYSTTESGQYIVAVT